jgi:hypothetical protein
VYVVRVDAPMGVAAVVDLVRFGYLAMHKFKHQAVGHYLVTLFALLAP